MPKLDACPVCGSPLVDINPSWWNGVQYFYKCGCVFVPAPKYLKDDDGTYYYADCPNTYTELTKARARILELEAQLKTALEAEPLETKGETCNQ